MADSWSPGTAEVARVHGRQIFGVVGVGGHAEANLREVLLVGAAHERRQPCRPADDEREHTRRERIERSGMTYASEADRAADDRHDVVGRRAGGFVDDENTVHAMLNAEC